MCFILTIGYGIIEVTYFLGVSMSNHDDYESLSESLSRVAKTAYKKLKYLGHQTSEQATDKTLKANNILGHSEGVASDDNDTLLSSPTSSSLVEDTLDTLGNIIIVIGVIAGIFLISFALIDELLFLAIWGIAGILSSFISGYILKGLSKIISLLSALQNTNSDEQ